MKCPLTAATPVRLALLAALGVAATAANAQSMVTARVLGAQPVVEQVPVQECGPNRASGTGAAVGAVTGGLIGSQIGRGNGHIAGAILGALGGAVLGNTAEAYNNGYGGCATRYSQRVTGYDVTYEYQGRQYQTRTAQAPGQWLQVPAPYGYEGQQQDYGYNNGGYNNYTVECASDSNRMRQCNWERRQGRPVIVQQLSNTQCIEGRNWGYNGNSIWVNGGCRARFGSR